MNKRYAKRRRVQNTTVHEPMNLKVDLPRAEPNKIPKYKLSDWKIRNKDGTGRYRNMTPSEFQEFKMNLDICQVKILKYPTKDNQKITEILIVNDVISKTVLLFRMLTNIDWSGFTLTIFTKTWWQL